MSDYQVIIVGEGPAGMSAALFLKKAKISVLMLEKGTPGGKLIWTSQVENYPGFKANSGVDLASIMYHQVKDADVPRKREEVLDIIRQKDSSFIVKTNKDEYTCDFVIFGAGTKVKKLGIPGEDLYQDKGLSFCALCDGTRYENEDVVVIGGGTSGFEEGLYLAKLCKSVTLISRSDHYKASDVLVEKAKATPNMRIMNNKLIKEFIGDQYLSGVVIEDKITGIEETINTHGVFIYIGFDPCSLMLEKYGVLDEKGYIYVDESRETNVPRLYAVGDCVHKQTRQVITAVSDGVVAAVAIIRKL